MPSQEQGFVKPTFILIAGPNGAGKSTSAPTLLSDQYDALEFVNADDIAKGLSAFHPERVAIPAGRILLRRFEELARANESFAIETTLSGRGYARHIAALKKKGYRFELIFLWLPSVELAVARVAQRVALGGHTIPEDVIRRRYQAGLNNFFELYQPLADLWKFYDSSRPHPRLIAYGEFSEVFTVDPEIWHNVRGTEL